MWKKKKKTKKVEKACEQRWRCLLLEGFSAMLISIFLVTGVGGGVSLKLKEERGLLMAAALQQEASQKERGMEWEAGGGGQRLAFT